MAKDVSGLLRKHGLHVTAQRMAVLRAVMHRPHCTADEVVSVATSDIGTISKQAVYDALGVLAETGVLRRIEPEGSPARFETRVGDNHHHLICRGCGCVVDVDCAVGHAPCLTPSNDHGFDIDTADVVFWGRCPACRKKRPKPAARKR